MPDHFLASGADEWGVADAGERELLADLYADLTRWGLARGIGDHQLGLPAGDDCADLWLDLGFARCPQYDFDIGDRPSFAGGGERMSIEAFTLNLA